MLFSIHFLRFVAAAVVVVSHSYNVFGFPKQVSVGDAGVDIFFIISGIVISLSTRDGSSPLRFAIKRFIRVVPSYWIATSTMIAFTYYQRKVLPPFEDTWRSLLILPKWGTDWWPIIFPGWTLNYEALFYVAFGLCLLFLKRNVGITCAILFALLASIKVPVPFSDGAIFKTEICLEFIYGLLLAEWIKTKPQLNHGLGLFCLAAAVVGFFLNQYGAVTRVVGWGVPSALLVVGFIQFEDLPKLRSRLFLLLGDASYPIYLFHIPVMLALREISNDVGYDIRQVPMFAIALATVLSIGVGILFRLAIESPMLKFLDGVLVRPNPGTSVRTIL